MKIPLRGSRHAPFRFIFYRLLTHCSNVIYIITGPMSFRQDKRVIMTWESIDFHRGYIVAILRWVHGMVVFVVRNQIYCNTYRAMSGIWNKSLSISERLLHYVLSEVERREMTRKRGRGSRISALKDKFKLFYLLFLKSGKSNWMYPHLF